MTKKNQARGGVGVTTQHDQRTIYRKKRMPFRRRRKWKLFKRKINAVSEKTLGSRTVVHNQLLQFVNTTSGNQISGAIYLYSQNGAGASSAKDLALIAGYENAGDQTAAAGETVDLAAKFLFQSAVMDVTFKNNSTYNDGLITTTNTVAKLEVDVYEISMKKNSEETGFTATVFESILADNATQTKAIGGAGTEISHDLRGVTPFDLTYVLSRWGVKIWKKTKYVVPNNDTFTYQVRDPRRHVAEKRDLAAQDGFNRPGWTRIVYFTAKLVPDLTVGTGTGTYQEKLAIGCTRKYFYKVEGINEDRTRYAIA